MTKEQQQVQLFMLKAEQPCPQKPTIPDLKTRKLRARLMMEEVLETINDGLGLSVEVETGLAEGKTSANNIEDYSFEDENEPNLVELADGLADLEYVQLGTAVAAGIDLEPIFQEVHRSNLQKFDGGYRREDGKWQKPPHWTPPDLDSIIASQIK